MNLLSSLLPFGFALIGASLALFLRSRERRISNRIQAIRRVYR